MSRIALALTVCGLFLTVPSDATAQDDVYGSAYHQYRVVTVADGFVNPWSMAWLPNGDMLVTERPGRLRIVRHGMVLPDPVEGVPEVFARGQGGLLEVLPHPDFASNRLLYLTFSKPTAGQATTALIRGRFENDRLTDIEELFVADSRGNGHYGSRLAFDSDGFLYMTVGDRQAPPTGDLESHPAQDISNHHGVTLRFHDDGRVPADNPFVGRQDAHPDIFSYGHRNAQGLAINPETGSVFLTEHGPQGGDELNLILPGRNYGWPVVGYGVNYRSGLAIHEGTMREGMESPAHFWVPSIAASGLMFYDGDVFPQWKGNLFAGGLAGEQIARLEMDGDRVVREETILFGMGRVRDVREGPDGFIYVAIEDRQGNPTPIVRLEPVGR